MLSGFAKEVEKNIRQYLPETYENALIQCQNNVKGNDQVLESIVIQKEGEVVSPMIYLDEYSKRYYQGESLSTILREIADFRTHFEDMPLPDVPDLSDYESVKDNLFVQMFDPEKNELFLQDHVHKSCGALTAVYRVGISKDEEMTASMVITNSHLGIWGIDADRLHEDALNAMNSRGICLYDMNELLMESFAPFSEKAENLLLSDSAESKIRGSEYPMFVLTNSEKEFGAAAILNNEVMGKIGELFGVDYYVLPSSRHELILVPDDDRFSQKELEAIVKNVNESQVSPEDYLSDKVQFYDAQSKTLLPEKPEKIEKEAAHEMKESLGKTGKNVAQKSVEDIKLSL
ncbi:MAG: hypothetical protein HFH24_03170 [Ruminococcus sp.]|nr:hypothetical protein [Ruminococcus sp.]